MKTKLAVFCLALMVLLLAAATAAAAPNPMLVRQVIAGGGGRISDGATLMLSSTIGEPVVGALTITGDYGEGAGFWQGLPARDYLYLPLITRSP